MSNLNVIGEFQFGISGVATTALTLRPPENFNLAINGEIRQIATFSRYTVISQGYYECLRAYKSHRDTD